MKKIKNVLSTIFLGVLFLLPSQSKAGLIQFVNNCGDAKLTSVDIWVNNVRTISNLKYRQGKYYIQINSHPAIIAVTVVGASDTNNALLNKSYPQNTSLHSVYTMILNGNISKSDYNPFQPLDFAVYRKTDILASDSNNIDILFCHGSTDTPELDIWETKNGQTKIVDNIKYNDYAGYVSLPVDDYQFELRLKGTTTTIGKYIVPLKSMNYKGFTFVIVASGFIDTSKNKNGSEFGLYSVLQNGVMRALPPANRFAKTQFINNCADTSVKAVDIWVNNIKTIPNIKFRESTALIDIPADLPIQIAITNANSIDTVGALKQNNSILDGFYRFLLVVEGMTSPSGYSHYKPLTLSGFGSTKFGINGTDQNPISFYYGVTDAPNANLQFWDSQNKYSALLDVKYGDFRDFFYALQYDDYKIKLVSSSNGNSLSSVDLKLKSNGMEHKAITIVASGFLDSTLNSNGPSIKLMCYDNLGQVVACPKEPINSVEYSTSYANGSNIYPNPSNGNTMIKLDLNSEDNLKLELFDSFGKSVFTTEFNNLSQGANHLNLNVNDLPSGIYRYTAKNGKDNIIGSISIVK